MSGASASAASPTEATASAPAVRTRMAVRLGLLALGAAAMLAGLYGGLWRLGFDLPHATTAGELHGPLLICGLFGTVIGLERAVALGRGLAFLAPGFAALGTLLLLAGAPVPVGAAAYAAAALVLAGATLVITLQQPAIFTVTLLAATLSWLAGDLLWLAGSAVPDVVGFWLGFLILTIAGERLELSRLTARKRGSEALFLLAVALLAAGAVLGPWDALGAPLLGLALLALTIWLLRHDVVRHTVRQPGRTRFMASCMLAGYFWLGAGGLLLLAMPPADTAFGYDAALHAVLIGFVLSMVFGHALIILPAVARVRIAYRPVLYGPLVLLHGSLALRIAGDVLAWQDGRLASGPLTLVALLGFVAAIATGIQRR
ncbi:hypothetical protein [Rhodovulum sp. PH10]|uniref:hypothetical protein n=1 Tax=Rhodovulum sp. PH10 TaxID=1187851 RepID=UPI0009FECE93|nr:hypothetical protein [Rhodovulum sp. PH10]